METRRLLLLACAAVAAAACSQPAPHGPDVCGLLSTGDVSAVLAGRASAGRPEHLGSRPFEVERCRWSGGDRSLALLASRSPDGDAAAARTAFESVHTTAVRDGVVAVDVPGLGDEAWWESDRLANQLHVLAGATSLTFTTRAPGGESPPRELLAAARAAIERLPRPAHGADAPR